MLGKCLRALCVLLAAWLTWLAMRGGMASMGLIRTDDQFYVGWQTAYEYGAISSQEDGLYIDVWETDYNFPARPFEIEWEKPDLDQPPRSALGWPGYVYHWSKWPHQVRRDAWVPRLPVAGLLLLWPFLRWVRARHRKKLASVPEFDVA